MSTDLVILRGTKPATEIRYTPSGRLDGTAKLVTRFASLFLSDYDPVRDRGTGFNTALRRGLVTNSQIVQQFALAAADVLRQLGDQSGYPVTEQIARIVLADFERGVSTLYLRVELQTPGGVTNIQLPVGLPNG